MTEETLQAIEARMNAATEGPWIPSVYGAQILTGDSWNTICWIWGGTGKDHRGAQWEDGRGPANPESNAQFIAHARTDIPALVAEVRRLREANKTMAVFINTWDNFKCPLENHPCHCHCFTDCCPDEIFNPGITAMQEALSGKEPG